MTQQATEPLDAIAVPRGEGEARWWFGQLAVIKATGEATGGAYTLVEITVAPGYRTPLHVHHREDEGFWVLDGHATFTVGEETIEAPAGTYLFGPRDVPHWWAAGPDGARVLYLFTPAGIEGLIEDMSVPAQTAAKSSPCASTLRAETLDSRRPAVVPGRARPGHLGRDAVAEVGDHREYGGPSTSTTARPNTSPSPPTPPTLPSITSQTALALT